MRADTLHFAKEKYFNGYSDTHSVQENFNLITPFMIIQEFNGQLTDVFAKTVHFWIGRPHSWTKLLLQRKEQQNSLRV